MKINQKSVPEEAPRQLKSTQDRTWDPFGMPRCVQERPKGISGASGECLRARSARPGSTQSVPKGASGRQRGRQGALSSSPRRPKSTPNRPRERPNLVSFVQLVGEALTERFSLIVVDLRSFSKVCEPSKVSRLSVKTGVWHFPR